MIPCCTANRQCSCAGLDDEQCTPLLASARSDVTWRSVDDGQLLPTSQPATASFQYRVWAKSGNTGGPAVSEYQAYGIL